jgi:hypothetical protein
MVASVQVATVTRMCPAIERRPLDECEVTIETLGTEELR